MKKMAANMMGTGQMPPGMPNQPPP